MKKYLFIKFIVGFLSISVWLITGCVGISHAGEKSTNYLSSKKSFLTDKQIKSLDTHAAKTLPECGFVYSKESVGTVTDDAIYECIERADYWFWFEGYKVLGLFRHKLDDFHGQFYNLKFSNGISNTQLSRFHILDDYLGKRLLPYISAISKLNQEKLLRKILIFYSDNLVFAKAMMDKGVSVRNVLLSQIGEGGQFWASCEAYMLFLNKNIEFYQSNNSLYEPIPDVDRGMGTKPSYRWEDLHHLTDTEMRTPCHDVIERLARANPELLNKKNNYDGATSLHYYVRGLYIKKSIDLKLLRVLTTSSNINMRANNGNTPLHDIFFGSADPTQEVIKALLALDANINIKNNKGNTPLHEFLARKLPEGYTKNHPKIIKLMVTLGAGINMKNNRGNTPLHEFLDEQFIQADKELLKLTSSITSNDLNIVKAMIELGADINIKNKKGIMVKDMLSKRRDLSGVLK